jgi:beta propeller repeat protein
MRRHWPYKVLVLSLVGVMALGGAAAGFYVIDWEIDFDVTGVATATLSEELYPEIDNRVIAYVQNDQDGTGTYVRVYDLKTGGVIRTIGKNDGHNQTQPDVSGDIVVWTDDTAGNNDVYMMNFRTGVGTSVAVGTDDQRSPRIDGNLIVWKNQTTGYLWYRDLDVGGTTGTRLTVMGNAIEHHDVDNGRIIATTPTNTIVAAAPRSPGPYGLLKQFYAHNVDNIKLHGHRAVFTYDGVDIKLLNLQTMAVSDVTTAPGTQKYPSVFNNTFAWWDTSENAGDIRYQAGFFWGKIDTGKQDYWPSLYGRRIAFQWWNETDNLDVQLATRSVVMSRFAGVNRYKTAAMVSSSYFNAAKNVVLCTGENIPDALAAGPLARALQAPRLLTKKDSLPDETRAEIVRLGATKVYIIGGTPTISKAVEDQLKKTYTTERIAGADRYETSAKIARRLQEIMGYDLVFRGVFTRGDNFPDALSVGPVAAGALAPIFLVRTDSVPASVASAVNDLDIRRGYVIGDTKSVNAATYDKLKDLIVANTGSLSPYLERWAGANRYETAKAVIEKGLANRWIDLDTLGVAVGTKFPDALGGGAALGYYGSAIILTDGASLSPATSAFLTNHEYEIGWVDVYGDKNSVSDAVYDAIKAKIK